MQWRDEGLRSPGAARTAQRQAAPKHRWVARRGLRERVGGAEPIAVSAKRAGMLDEEARETARVRPQRVFVLGDELRERRPAKARVRGDAGAPVAELPVRDFGQTEQRANGIEAQEHLRGSAGAEGNVEPAD